MSALSRGNSTSPSRARADGELLYLGVTLLSRGELLSPRVQATGTENVQDKVSDWELPMILNCESESSRIRRIPIEYVSEIPCMRVETESDLLFGPGPTMIYMMQQLQYPGLDQCPGYTRIY